MSNIYEDREYKGGLANRRTIKVVGDDGAYTETFKADIIIDEASIIVPGTLINAEVFNTWNTKVDKLTSGLDITEINGQGTASAVLSNGKLKFSNLKGATGATGATGIGADPRFEFTLTLADLQNPGAQSPPYRLIMPISSEILLATSTVQILPKDIATKTFMDKNVISGTCHIVNDKVVIDLAIKNVPTLNLLAIAYRKEV